MAHRWRQHLALLIDHINDNNKTSRKYTSTDHMILIKQSIFQTVFTDLEVEWVKYV